MTATAAPEVARLTKLSRHMRLIPQKNRTRVWVVRIVIIAVALSSWEIAGQMNGGVFIAPFSATLEGAIHLVTTSAFWEAFAESNKALAIGVPLALCIGFPVGFLIGRIRGIDRATGFLVDIMLAIPMVSIIPIVIVALGLTLSARATVVFFFAVPLAALYARAAVRIVDRDLLEMVQAFQGTKLQLWTKVILPSSRNSLFVGLRLAVAHGISGMIVIELVLIPAGLGDLLLTYRSQFAAEQLFATTLLIGLQGFLMMSIIEFIRQRIVRNESS